MKKTYRFFGAVSEIFGVASLKVLGQAVELTEDLYRDAVAGGCALLSAEEFGSIFRPNDHKEFATPGARANAPADFRARYNAGLNRLHEIREAFLAGQPFPAFKKTTEEVKSNG